MVVVDGQGAVSGSFGQGVCFHVIRRAPFPEYTSIYGSEFGFAPNVRVLRASAVQDTGISDSKC